MTNSAVLLSINPEYVRKIESGEKKYEFRKVIFAERQAPIRTIYSRGEPKQQKNPEAAPILIYIYETAPAKAITGYFHCEEIISNSPQKLWELFGNSAGIAEENFFQYFRKPRYPDIYYKTGHALRISEYTPLENPVKLATIGVQAPPQNFQYLTGTQNTFLQITAGIEIPAEEKESEMCNCSGWSLM